MVEPIKDLKVRLVGAAVSTLRGDAKARPPTHSIEHSIPSKKSIHNSKTPVSRIHKVKQKIASHCPCAFSLPLA
jgi:hypothetical protein